MEIQRYNTTAIIIHWLMAILIFAMIILGFYMGGLEKGSDERSWFFALHKSIGLSLGLLAIIRLVWKLCSTPPRLPDYIPLLQRKAATATHHLLYLMLFLLPVSGYFSSSLGGYTVKFWGIVLPHWGWKNTALSKLCGQIHDIGAFCLIALLLLHIAGAIYHVYNKETELIKRMWFS